MTSTSSPTIIFLDLPPKTFIGINLSSFNSSPNFHGVANLPDGLHFVYTGTDASLSIRHGRWLRVLGSNNALTPRILRWNTALENLELLETASVTAQQVVKRLPELQRRGLVDYAALRDASASLQNRQDNVSKTNIEDDQDDQDDQEELGEGSHIDPWPTLTSHITTHLCKRVLAHNPQAHDNGWTLTSISSAPSDSEHIPGLSSDEANSVLSDMQTLNLLAMDLKQTWKVGAQGRQRTDMARDRSWYLENLIDKLQVSDVHAASEEISKQQAARELLGELQFTFLMVLCLANYSCLEQWKRILSVLFTCRKALLEVEGYFVEAIKVLRQQLDRVEDVEGGLFELADETQSRWLRQLIRTFRNNVDEAYADDVEESKGKSEHKGTEVKGALAEMESWLRDKYGWEDDANILRRGMIQLEDGEMVELQADGWDEEEETGEYAPVIVET